MGQLVGRCADARKVRLAAGAVAGMAAPFGTPVSAVLLAIELLLFEYRPRSLIPVAFAAATATAVRVALVGPAAMFPMGATAAPGARALVAFVLLGAVLGAVAHGITRTLYAIEDLFAHSHVHWMWWPAIGAIAVGVVGLIAPHTLGVGYDNIQAILGGSLLGPALLGLVVWKLVSWIISLGSGTSGGTLAPLFTIGGGAGALLGALLATALPGWGLDPRVAGLAHAPFPAPTPPGRVGRPGPGRPPVRPEHRRQRHRGAEAVLPAPHRARGAVLRDRHERTGLRL